MSEATVLVRPVLSRADRRQFIQFPYTLYKNDPHFVPPLRMDRKDLINPKKNPFFENARAQLFLATQNGEVVGRISAQVNDVHNQRYNERTGHFGFFDVVDDEKVSKALFAAAENWLKEQGMQRMVGPFSLSINEESGLLIKGFDRDPFPYMPHNFPYYQNLVEGLGFQKVKDLIAYDYDATRPVPETAMQIADFVKAYPGLVVRDLDMKNLDRDIKIIADVFNSAWSKNWGFIPWSQKELSKIAKDFKMIMDPGMALIAEVNGEPAAISIAFPNYHEIIKDLNGKLLPFGFLKFLYRLKTKKYKSSRLALLGIKKEFRNDVLAGLSVYLYTEMHKRGQARGQRGGELSWTLDDNEKINKGIEMMGGVPYKRYRVYGKDL